MLSLVVTLAVESPAVYCATRAAGPWPTILCALYRLLFDSWVTDVLFAVVVLVVIGFLLRFGWEAAGRITRGLK